MENSIVTVLQLTRRTSLYRAEYFQRHGGQRTPPTPPPRPPRTRARVCVLISLPPPMPKTIFLHSSGSVPSSRWLPLFWVAMIPFRLVASRRCGSFRLLPTLCKIELLELYILRIDRKTSKNIVPTTFVWLVLNHLRVVIRSSEHVGTSDHINTTTLYLQAR